MNHNDLLVGQVSLQYAIATKLVHTTPCHVNMVLAKCTKQLNADAVLLVQSYNGGPRMVAKANLSAC